MNTLSYLIRENNNLSKYSSKSTIYQFFYLIIFINKFNSFIPRILNKIRKTSNNQ